MRFAKGTMLYNIIFVLSQVGEFPYSSLDIFGRRDMVLRVLTKMKQEGLVDVTGKKDLKRIRITLKKKNSEIPFKKYADRISPEVWNQYLEDSKNNNLQRQELRIKRRMRLAETLGMMHMAELSILKTDKPSIVMPHIKNEPHIYLNKFYTSTEIKGYSKEHINNVAFTRIMGLLISAGGVYSVYNIYTSIFHWRTDGEYKIKEVIKELLHQIYGKDEKNDIGEDIRNASTAMILGTDMDACLTLLENKNLHSKKKENDEDQTGKLLVYRHLDMIFEHIHYIPLDANGVSHIKILTSADWRQILRDACIDDSSLLVDSSQVSIECDAYDSSINKYYLLFMDGDIKRLFKFKLATELYPNNKYEIYCFSYQAEFVNRFMNSEYKRSDISTVDICEALNLFKESEGYGD